MPWCHAERNEEDGRAWYRACEDNWRAGVEYEFSAFSTSGEFLGAGGLNQFNRVHNFANLGYWVRQSRQGSGIAVEVARLLADFGFRVLRLARIEIVVAEDNLPSRRVAEKLGATCEGVSRRRILLRGESIDAVMYSLIPRVDP
jgi:ribosomal-protein-serine acetyltransferase